MADRPIPARSEVPEESTWNLKDAVSYTHLTLPTMSWV